MSQIAAFNPDTLPADQYTQEKGIYVAESFAAGESLKAICEGSEGYLPGMLYVKRWRRMFPAFDSLMVEAAECRAENMAEEILEISDDSNQQAAHNRNRMNAREKLAGWMSPSAYGDKKQDPGEPGDGQPVFMLSDEQLLAIAAGKMPTIIDGECERVTEGGVHPPRDPGPGTEYEVSGSRKPSTDSGSDSVTTIERTGHEVADAFEKIISEREHSVTTTDSDAEKNFVEPGERLSFVGMDDD